MGKKLTLRLDEDLIKRAKRYARKQGISVSRLVANYFSVLEQEQEEEAQKLPPVTKSLSGILKGKDIDRETYRKHLEEKHLS